MEILIFERKQDIRFPVLQTRIMKLLELRIKKVLLLALCLGTIVLSSCKHNSLDVDVSQVNVPPVKVERLEKDMFSMPPDSGSIAARTPALIEKYGPFYANFVRGFINDGGLMNVNYAQSVKRFITDKDMHETYDSCEKVYPNMAFLEEGLTDVFKHYKHYFPDSSLPHVLTLMSGFNYALIYYNNTLAISLEMYLGSKSSFYKRVDFPHYKVMHMNRNYLLSDGVYGWLESDF